MAYSRSLWFAVLAALALPHAAGAQNNPGYFIPPAGQTARPSAQGPAPGAARPTSPRRPPAVQPLAPPPGAQSPGPVAGPGSEDPQGPQLQLQLPPPPALPTMARGAPPPTPVIGVLGIPEIMRASTAGQQVEKTIGERREKLNEDAQKEQAVWREMQQGLANDRSKLSADQIRAREKDLQDRITNAQKTFRDRNRIIQEAGQYGLAQIERMLVAVIRQVAESRGMNLVLHRAQVALNVNEFDITEQVVEQLNKVLPSVSLPADGVEPPLASATPPAPQAVATPPAAPATPPTATPAANKPDAPAPKP